jgi:hypothetical protein
VRVCLPQLAPAFEVELVDFAMTLAYRSRHHIT